MITSERDFNATAKQEPATQTYTATQLSCRADAKQAPVIDAVLVAERGRTQVVLINMFDRQFIVVDGIVLAPSRLSQMATL